MFATKYFEKSQFLLEYRGFLTESEPTTPDTYVYEFTHNGKSMW